MSKSFCSNCRTVVLVGARNFGRKVICPECHLSFVARRRHPPHLGRVTIAVAIPLLVAAAVVIIILIAKD